MGIYKIIKLNHKDLLNDHKFRNLKYNLLKFLIHFKK